VIKYYLSLIFKIKKKLSEESILSILNELDNYWIKQKKLNVTVKLVNIVFYK